MKRLGRIIVLGLCFACILAVIRSAFHLDRSEFWILSCIIYCIAVAGAVLFNILYVGKYQKEMQKAAVLLEEGRTHEYLAAVKDLHRRAKGKYLKNVFQLNLSAGYCELEQFNKAIELLEGLAQAQFPRPIKMVYYLNLCVCYFYTGQSDKAMETYHVGEKEFAPFREGATYGGNIAIIDMFAAIEDGRYEQASELLVRARKTWKNPRFQDDYQHIEALLNEKGHQ